MKYIIDVAIAILGKIDGVYTWEELWLIIRKKGRFVERQREGR